MLTFVAICSKEEIKNKTSATAFS